MLQTVRMRIKINNINVYIDQVEYSLSLSLEKE